MDSNDLIKVIVIGNSLVGKTSYIQRYVNNGFRLDYKTTIGVDFAIKQVQVNQKKTVKVQLWDIAGQERYIHLTRAYYRDAKGCVLMFSLNDAQSFLNVRKWKADLDAKVRTENGSRLPCILVANKSDQSPSEITDTEIQAMCEELHFVGWTKTSVKDGTMVAESMSYLLNVILGIKASTASAYLTSITLSASLTDGRNLSNKKNKCRC